MSLSCECDFDPSGCEPGQSYYYYSNDFCKLESTRRKRCVNCNALIDLGSDVVEFERERVAYNEIEERIKGESYGIAPHYLCFDCGGIFLSLRSIGYCIDIYNLDDDLEDYKEISGFKQAVVGKRCSGLPEGVWPFTSATRRRAHSFRWQVGGLHSGGVLKPGRY